MPTPTKAEAAAAQRTAAALKRTATAKAKAERAAVSAAAEAKRSEKAERAAEEKLQKARAASQRAADNAAKLAAEAGTPEPAGEVLDLARTPEEPAPPAGTTEQEPAPPAGTTEQEPAPPAGPTNDDARGEVTAAIIADVLAEVKAALPGILADALPERRDRGRDRKPAERRGARRVTHDAAIADELSDKSDDGWETDSASSRGVTSGRHHDRGIEIPNDGAFRLPIADVLATKDGLGNLDPHELDSDELSQCVLGAGALRAAERLELQYNWYPIARLSAVLAAHDKGGEDFRLPLASADLLRRCFLQLQGRVSYLEQQALTASGRSSKSREWWQHKAASILEEKQYVQPRGELGAVHARSVKYLRIAVAKADATAEAKRSQLTREAAIQKANVNKDSG